MANRAQKLKMNSLCSILYQFLLICCGLVLPRCYLMFYGSEVNGLIASITQFLSFINICDFGISAVVSSALYKPLAQNDTVQISKIFVYSKKFFRVISYILLAYVVVLLFIYPQMVSGSFDYTYTIVLIVVMCISQFAQYFIGISYQILLNADQRSYVQLIINGSTLLLNTFLSISIMALGGSVQLVKVVASLIYVLRPILMSVYIKKCYKIDYSVKADSSAIPEKWNGVIQHIAYMVYENTDIAVLTIFSSLSNVSIYSVYYLVVNSIKTLINAVTTGVQALFGNMIANQEREGLEKAYDFFDWGLHLLTTLLFTITGVLIVPFILIYTSNVNDANYYVPAFAVIITVANAVNTIRNGMYLVIRAAGHYKVTQTASLIEAMLNLLISVISVFHFGLIGIAIGTLVAALYYSLYEMLYLSENIICRSKSKFLKQVLLDIISVAVMIITTFWLKFEINSYISWIRAAIIVTLICVVDMFFIQMIFSRKNMCKLKNMVISKMLRH